MSYPMQVNMQAQKRKNTFVSFRKTKRFIPFYIMLLPAIVFFLIFSYIPMSGIVIAFKDYNFLDGIMGSPWAGLKHINRFLTNGDFWVVFKNTLYLSFLRLLFGFPAPIIFALLLNEITSQRFKKLTQTISYLPHFISWVVISGILFNMFSSDGMINNIIVSMGGQPVGFLSSESIFRQFLVGTAIWKELGWGAIIYLAALSTIDTEMYEAAYIDGANRWQRLVYITLPSISSVISTMFVLSFANFLSVGFDQILVLINPAVSGVAEIIDYYIYRVGITQVNNYSYATAVGLFKSVICLVLVVITNWGANKIDKEGAIW